MDEDFPGTHGHRTDPKHAKASISTGSAGTPLIARRVILNCRVALQLQALVGRRILVNFFPFRPVLVRGLVDRLKGLPTGHRFMERSQSRSVDQTRRDRRRSVGRPSSVTVVSFSPLQLSLLLSSPPLKFQKNRPVHFSK